MHKMLYYKQILVASFVIVALLAAQSASAASAASNTAIKVQKANGQLIELNEDNWHLMLNGEWMIEFFDPLCSACKNLAPVWKRYAGKAKTFNVHVAKIDVTTSPSLKGRFLLNALPKIIHVKNGEFRHYHGAHNANALFYFLKKESWKAVQPLSFWTNPNTLHMSFVSSFYTLLNVIKLFNSRLQLASGMTTRTSYAIFLFVTIFLGVSLGLVLVYILDSIFEKKDLRPKFMESPAGVKDLQIKDDVDEAAAADADGDDDDGAEEPNSEDLEEDDEDQDNEEEAKKQEANNSTKAD